MLLPSLSHVLPKHKSKVSKTRKAQSVDSLVHCGWRDRRCARHRVHRSEGDEPRIGDDDPENPFAIFGKDVPSRDNPLFNLRKIFRGRLFDLGLLNTPKLGSDPLSVQKVDPLKLTGTFGPGYALKAIIIEATDEPLSENLGQHLPWFDELWSDPKKRQCALDGNCVSYSVHPFMIGGGHLKREK